MSHINIIVNREAVNDYLIEHGLETGNVPIVAALMQHHEDAPHQQPQLMLIIEVDGKKLVAKTTLRLMEMACSAIRSASGVPFDAQQPLDAE